MTNTVTIPSNVLPEDGRFGSGPTKIRPEQIQALDKGARNLLGTSHRQTPIKQVVGSIREGLSEFFQIPDGYEVVLGNGGASAFWDIACASLITRKAAFGTYGSFSSKFAKSAQSAPFLEEPEIFAGEPGTYRLPELTEYVDTYCWAHNETSTGVAAPIKRIAGTKEQGALTLIDATSGAGALPVDISQTDAYYFSPQKAFGSDGGLWIAVFAQCRHHLGCIDAIVDIDGDHGVGARVPVVYERGGVIGLLRPLVQQGRRPCAAGRSPGEPTVVVEPTNLVFQHDQRCHCRRVERLILAGILDGRSQGKERRNPAACARKIHAFGDAVGAFDCSGGEYGNP